MRTFAELARQAPTTAEGLVNAAIGGGIILAVIVIVLIVRIWKEGDR